MMTRGFFGFLGRNPFSAEAEDFREKWAKMSKDEKIDFIDKRMEKFDFSEDSIISKIDEHCESWLKMTTEEKKAAIEKRKNQACGRFGFGGFSRGSDFFENKFENETVK